ncbi:hypothetical protein VP01_4157g1 [Puccinia sorghi]|uniref:Integrase catalytic domain-containing protein n=1 Tax=Puccinia sorghi TaxID=27349 RepID=A0A0L6UR00_9BASI|nr:hypothetical protein VP01_4157g1 [Puccinia sorghi]
MKEGQAEQSVSSFFFCSTTPVSSFILESGSSAHMTANLNLSSFIDHSEKGVVHTLFGTEALNIKGIGDAKLEHENGSISLKKVLYVPQLAVSLLSVQSLVLDGHRVTFEMNSFTVVNSSGVKITGKYIGNLPTIEFFNQSHQSYFSQSKLLHKSLGHMSYHRLRQLLGLQVKDHKACEACAVAKVTKKILSHQTFSSLQTFQRDPSGFNSCTRYCSAIPVRSKSDVSETIAQVVSLEAKRLGYFPTVIHSDRGSEFINSHLLEFCNKHSIRARQSDAYTPQQNRLAERFKRTILESMCAIFQDTGLNKRLWNEIVKTISPYELFKGRNLPLEFFNPIGIRVSYLILPERHCAKLESYRILADDGRFVNTCHVKFLDFINNKRENTIDDSDLIILADDKIESPPEEKSSASINDIENNSELSDSEEGIASSLVPDVSRVLRERNSKVKPVKYTYLASDPVSYKMAMKSSENSKW